jgi:hypothetical protein
MRLTQADFFERKDLMVTELPEELKAQRLEFLSSGISNVFNPRWNTWYSEIEPELRTGDLILVHGKYQYSWVVELLQGSKWGHSAMIVKASDIDPENKFGLPRLLLWEANIGGLGLANLWGNRKGEIKDGPMLVDLRERLYKNQTSFDDIEIVYRPLHTDNDSLNFTNLPTFFTDQIEKGFPTDLEVLYSVYLGRKYNRTSEEPKNHFQLQYSISSGTINLAAGDPNQILALPKQDLPEKNKIYCSELVALTYKFLGLLTARHVSNAYSPKDFSQEGSIALEKRAWLGSEMYLNMID